MDFHIMGLASEKIRHKISDIDFKLTRSWRATILLSSFVSGVVLASFINVYAALVLVFCAVFLFTLVQGRKKLNAVFAIVSLLFTLGIFRYQFALPDRGHNSIVTFIGETIELEGVVVDDVNKSDKMQSLVLGELEIGGERVSQKLLAAVPLYPEFVFGDRIKLACEIQSPEPFDGFRYDRYLAREGILATCQSYKEPFHLGRDRIGIRGRLLDFKADILTQARLVFHEPYAALLEGLLLGEKNLPKNIEEEFRRVGLSHIIAASGQNVSLVANVLMAILTATLLRRRHASMVVLVGILAYVFLAGADSAVVRAGIMGSVVVFSKAVGRVPSSRNLLLAALAVMLFHNPFLLRDDVGFQLSFAATTGIVALQPRLSRFFVFVPKYAGLREAFSMSVAAIAATLPVMLMSFGQVSIVAPIANLIVLPLIPFVMIAGAAVILISVFFYAASLYIAAPVVGGLKIMLGVSHVLSLLPFASADILHVSWLRAIFLVCSIILLRFILSLKSVSASADSNTLTLKYFVVSCVLLCVPMVPDFFTTKTFTANFFSVGQGDATFLEFPNSERWLIDGGPDNTVLTKLGQVLPWYSRRVDALIPTHADADHIIGLVEVSRRYDIDRVYLSADDQIFNMKLLREIWNENDVDVSFVSAGDRLDLENIGVKVLSPPKNFISDDRNDLSLVLAVKYKNSSLLFTGDITKAMEIEMLAGLSKVDVLKVGHHGSYTSTSQEFVDVVTPDLAVISVGLDNRYNHPHGVVLDRLKKSGAEILRTDLFGDVLVSISEDGEVETRTGTLWY